MMLSAKTPDTMHNMNLPIGRGENKRLHLGRMLFRVMVLSCTGGSHFLDSFGRVSLPKHRAGLAKHSLALFLNRFKRSFPAKLSLPDLLAFLSRWYLAETVFIPTHS